MTASGTVLRQLLMKIEDEVEDLLTIRTLTIFYGFQWVLTTFDEQFFVKSGWRRAGPFEVSWGRKTNFCDLTAFGKSWRKFLKFFWRVPTASDEFRRLLLSFDEFWKDVKPDFGAKTGLLTFFLVKFCWQRQAVTVIVVLRNLLLMAACWLGQWTKSWGRKIEFWPVSMKFRCKNWTFEVTANSERNGFCDDRLLTRFDWFWRLWNT